MTTLPWVWGATDDEVHATYPCEQLVGPGAARVIRAVDTTADAASMYARRPGETSNRLVGVIDLPMTGRFAPSARRWLLAWGDLPMMRKQLLVLSGLAESSAG